jgi:hypothetical protein
MPKARRDGDPPGGVHVDDGHSDILAQTPIWRYGKASRGRSAALATCDCRSAGPQRRS